MAKYRVQFSGLGNKRNRAPAVVRVHVDPLAHSEKTVDAFVNAIHERLARRLLWAEFVVHPNWNRLGRSGSIMVGAMQDQCVGRYRATLLRSGRHARD